jgi:hypothetical protein
MPPLHYDAEIKVGDTITITEARDVYHEIFPNEMMAFYFGIGQYDTFRGLTGIVQRVRTEGYLNKWFHTYEIYSDGYRIGHIPYIFPPWLIQKVRDNDNPTWEV